MNCTLCPRMCGADRELFPGRCGCTNTLRVARAAPHMWEEPVFRGSEAAGRLFFALFPRLRVTAKTARFQGASRPGHDG